MPFCFFCTTPMQGASSIVIRRVNFGTPFCDNIVKEGSVCILRCHMCCIVGGHSSSATQPRSSTLIRPIHNWMRTPSPTEIFNFKCNTRSKRSPYLLQAMFLRSTQKDKYGVSSNQNLRFDQETTW